MQESLSNSEVRYIVNHYIDTLKLLHSLNIEVKPNSTMYCPFHPNKNTPSAHLYQEEDGSYNIFCFSEHKMFSNVDIYKTYLPQIDLKELAQKLYERFNENDKLKLKSNINKEVELPELPYIEDLRKFKKRQISYQQLLKGINMALQHDSTYILMSNLYNQEAITECPKIKDKYLYYIQNYPTQMKFISASQLLKVQDLPDFMRDYILHNGDIILIPNIINDVIHSITFRNIQGKRQFLKLGVVSPLLYNLGNLPEDFHYGTPLVLVEGNFDCDTMRTIYPYTVASLTSTLSPNQIQLISHLTNKVIIAYDNDEAGLRGYYSTSKKLRDLGLTVIKFNHYNNLKDVGDLIDIKLKDEEEFNYIMHSYKSQIESYL